MKLLIFNDALFVYSLIIRIFCIGMLVSTMEYLYSLDQYSNHGLFSWKVFKLTSKVLNAGISGKNWDHLFSKDFLKFTMILRFIVCIMLLAVPVSPMSIYLITVITLSSLWLVFRNVVGNDGSDQMNLITSITLFITFLFFNDNRITQLGLYFICCQAILSYVVAGLAKLVSPTWRIGLAIYKIMNTTTYGDKNIAAVLRKSSIKLTRYLNWNIILFESLFFTVVLLPSPFFFIFLAWGFFFHLSNAVLMGLNGFFWAFLATYPAIVFVNLQIQHFHPLLSWF